MARLLRLQLLFKDAAGQLTMPLVASLKTGSYELVGNGQCPVSPFDLGKGLTGPGLDDNLVAGASLPDCTSGSDQRSDFGYITMFQQAWNDLAAATIASLDPLLQDVQGA